jgi:SAM-dependent methyltransferase
MQERHLNRQRYFDEQAYTTEKYVIPFIEQYQPIKSGMHALEIGCGEAGNLLPFLERDCICTGIDLSESQIERAKVFYQNNPKRNNLSLFAKDIYDYSDFSQKYDIVIMRDVIEHIPQQEKFIPFLQKFTHKNSVVFFGFPPWQNPFGGHQQMCKSKVLANFPYIHLFPMRLYQGILRMFGETENTIKGLSEIKETGISIERFERSIKNSKFSIQKKQFYFINPNYEVKFGLKPRNIFSVLEKVKILRNFFTTCAYYLIINK